MMFASSSCMPWPFAPTTLKSSGVLDLSIFWTVKSDQHTLLLGGSFCTAVVISETLFILLFYESDSNIPQ